VLCSVGVCRARLCGGHLLVRSGPVRPEGDGADGWVEIQGHREYLPGRSCSAHDGGQSTTVDGPTRRAPLGAVARARSGDKGGTANVGVWARSQDAASWLATTLTPERIRELLPEAADLPVAVHPLPNLRAVNVVIEGLLGQGVAASTRFDPQGKAVGEWLLSRTLEIPEALL
jgi:hypothetical protein